MVSPVGMGTWAIGGPFRSGDQPLGWGVDWDREEAKRALRAAFDSGITVFDTADAYGAGEAERLVGEALGSVREEIAIISKWGNVVDEPGRQLLGTDASPGYVRTALEASLRRLGTEHVDLYLLHLSGLPVAEAESLLSPLQRLLEDGLIGAYGWSTDEPELAAAWLGQSGFGAVEFEINALRDAPALVAVSEAHDLTALARGPLATGLLGGAYRSGSLVEDEYDLRKRAPEWLNYFVDGRPVGAYAQRLDAIAEILQSGGRTLAQGALCWVLARSPQLIPIPGAKTVAQAVENADAMRFGPLDAAQMAEIERLTAAVPA